MHRGLLKMKWKLILFMALVLSLIVWETSFVHAQPSGDLSVKSVQNGTLTVAAATTNVIINSVDTTQAFVNCYFRTTASAPNQVPTCRLTNATYLNVTTGGATANTIVSWYVVEFVSGASIQRGETFWGTGTASQNITITSVNLSATFVTLHSRASTTTTTIDEQRVSRANLTNSTNLYIRRGETGIASVNVWQVIELNNVSVQSGDTKIIDGTRTAAAVINAVNLSNTFLVFSREAEPTANGFEPEYYVEGNFSNTTGILFKKEGNNNNSNISWFAVSVIGATVQATTHLAATTQLNLYNTTLKTINFSNTAPFISTTVNGTSSDQDSGNFWYRFDNATAINFSRMSTQNVRSNVSAFIVQWPIAAATDATPPQWSNNYTNSTFAGSTINHSVNWTDGTALSGFIFSFDNGNGSFLNDTWVSMIGTANQSNATKVVNSTISSTIRWIVYANDSSNNLNATNTFQYITDASPQIQFISPTPANASSQSTPYVEINVSVSEANLTNLTYNWNMVGFQVSDDFNRADSGSLGSSWTEVEGDWEIDTNRLQPLSGTHAPNRLEYSGQNLSTINQYAAIKLSTWTGADSQATIIFRYTDNSSSYYRLFAGTEAGGVAWGLLGGGEDDDIAAGSLSFSSGDVFAATIEGRYNNTVIRIWKNPTATTPTSYNTWGTNSPDLVLTNTSLVNSVETGNKVGLYSNFNNAGEVFLDDFYAGDAPSNYTIYNNSLVLSMNFDNITALGEGANNVSADGSRYNNSGLCGGMPNGICNYTTGKYGSAMYFDGGNDYVNIGDIPTPTSFTISAWIYPTTIPNGSDWDWLIVDKGATEYNFMIRGSGGAIPGSLMGTAADQQIYDALFNFSSPENLDKWYHVAFVFDNNADTNYLYRNGVQVNSTSNTASITDTANSLLIGMDNNFGVFNGTIDEVRIWNRSLSADEVSQMYMTNLQKFNTTQWYLYVNQSKNATAVLDTGTYTYYTYASDVFSNANQTDLRYITISTAADSCTCTDGASWTISNGDQCTRSATCNLGNNPFRVMDGALRISSTGKLIAQGCYVQNSESLFVQQDGGLICRA